MKTAHTATPWFAQGAGVYSEDPRNEKPGTPMHHALIAATGDDGDENAAAEQKANAEFIARACSAHYELLDAMKALLDAVRKEPAMNGRKYDALGQQVIKAIQKATAKPHPLKPEKKVMSEAKPTPGPWELGTHPGDHNLNIIKPVLFGNRVTVLPQHEGGHVSIKNIADARLIAAAPDLLEALTEIKAAYPPEDFCPSHWEKIE